MKKKEYEIKKIREEDSIINEDEYNLDEMII